MRRNHDGEIVSVKYQGHRGPVLCLDVTNQSGHRTDLDCSSSCDDTASSSVFTSSPILLLSGSEDRTARIWDVRDHRRRACLCIQTRGEVLAATFAPPRPRIISHHRRVGRGRHQEQEQQQQRQEQSLPTTTTTTTPSLASSGSFGHDYTVYLGVENTVLEYDLRKATTTPILYEPTRDLGPILQNQDEVNQICLAYGYKNINISTVHHHNKTNNNNNKNNRRTRNKRGGGNNNKKRQSSSSSTSSSSFGMDGSTNSNCPLTLVLAACDDAGTIRYMEVQEVNDDDDDGAVVDAQDDDDDEEEGLTVNQQLSSQLGPKNCTSHILHHDSNGVALVPTCTFRPNPSFGTGGSVGRLELVSGGTDCTIHYWDITKPRKPISSFTINNNNNNSDSSNVGGTTGSNSQKPQICNPPMVHSLAWSPAGRYLAAGLGDGSIGIFSIENRSLVHTGLLSTEYGASHDASVASVVFPSFTDGSAERILCSGGSDGSIFFWELPTEVDDDGYYDNDDDDRGGTSNGGKRYQNEVYCSTRLFPPTLLQRQQDDIDEGTGTSSTTLSSSTTSLATSTTTTLDRSPRQILFGIPHGRKMNWITPAISLTNNSNGSRTQQYRDTVFVADTSTDITAYTIPLLQS